MKRYRYDQIAKAEPTVTRYKLYKSKTKWVVRGMSSVAIMFGVHELEVHGIPGVFGPQITTAQADTVTQAQSSAGESVTSASTSVDSTVQTPVATVASTATADSEQVSSDTDSTASNTETAASSATTTDMQADSASEMTPENAVDTATDADTASQTSQTAANQVEQATTGSDDTTSQSPVATTTTKQAASTTNSTTTTDQAADVQQQAQSVMNNLQQVIDTAAQQAAANDQDQIVNNAAYSALQTHLLQEMNNINVALTSNHDGDDLPEGISAAEFGLTQANQILNNMRQELDVANQMMSSDQAGYDAELVETAQNTLGQVNLPESASAEVDAYGDLILSTSNENDYQTVVNQLTAAGLMSNFRYVIDPTTLDYGLSGYSDSAILQGAKSAADTVLKRSFPSITMTTDATKATGAAIYYASNITNYNLFAPLIAQLQKVYASGTASEIMLATAELDGAYQAFMQYNGGGIPTYDDQQQSAHNYAVAITVNVDENNNIIMVSDINAALKAGYVLNSAGKIVDPTTGASKRGYASPIGLTTDTYYVGTVGDTIPNTTKSLTVPNFTYVNTTYTTGSSKLVSMTDKKTIQLVINHWTSGSTSTTTPTVTKLTATVGDVTKTADGTTMFTTVPKVTLSNSAKVPTLATSDFDWSAVKAVAGTYAVTLNATGIKKITDANANTTLATTAITAGKAIIKAPATTALTATVGSVSKTYDGTTTFTTLPKVTLSNSAVVPTLTTSDFDWSNVKADAGSYAVTLGAAGIKKIVDANTNTTLAAASVTAGKAVINKAAVTVSVKDATKVEGAADPSFSELVNGQSPDGDDVVYTVTRDKGETPGTYAITVTANAADNPNYTVTTKGATLTITAKPVTTTTLKATIGSVTKTYDGTTTFTDLPTVKLSSGTVPTLTASDFNWGALTANIGITDVTLNAAGIKKITDANANTTLASADITKGKATINPANVTITANAKTKVAGDADPDLTATVDGKPAQGDAVHYTLSREAGETVGQYGINVEVVAADNPNYNVTFNGGIFTITAAPVTTTALTATVGSVTKIYDGTTTYASVPTVTLSGLTGVKTPTFDAGDFDWSRVSANVGSYAVTLNSTGIDKVLAANAKTTLASADIAAGVAKVTPVTLQVKVDNKIKEVGQADPTFTATVDGKPADGIAPVYTFSREPGETAGNYLISAVATSTDNPNYILNVTQGVLTISKAVPATTALKATVNDVSKTYDGTTTFNHLPSVLLSGLAGVVIPTLDQSDFDWSDVQANTGSYNVTLSTAGIQKILSANTNTTLATTDIAVGHAVINKANVTVTADNATKTAGDTDADLTASVSGQPVNGTDVAYTVTREVGETVGSYDITVVPGTNTNYNVKTVSGTMTIVPRGAALVVGSLTKTYDGTANFNDVPAVTITGATGVTMPTLTTADFDWSDVSANAGSYHVTLNETGKAVIQTANTGLTFVATTAGRVTIDQAKATIDVADANKQAGAVDPTWSVDVQGTVNGDKLNYTVSRTAGESAGTYPITVTLGDNPNYNVTVHNGMLTIAANRIQATVGSVVKTYDGTTTFNTVPTVTLSKNSLTVPTLTHDDFDWTDVQADAGSYKVTLSASGIQKIANANAGTALAATDVTAGTATINKANVTVAAVDANKMTGDPDAGLTATVTGQPASGTAVAYTVTRETGEAVGTYEITVVPGTNANYNVKTVGATMTITPRGTALVVGSLTKTYDGTADFTSVPVVTITGTTSATVPTLTHDDFDWSNVSAEAGSYHVLLNEVGKTAIVNANPGITIVATTAGRVTITPAKATIAVTNASKQAGTTDPSWNVDVQGAIGNEILNYTIARTAGEGVGTYPITITAGVNPNYDVSVQNATLTIKAIDAHATVGTVTKTYDGTSDFTTVPTVTLTESGLTMPMLTHDDFDWSAVGTDADTYSVTLSAAGREKLTTANPTITLSDAGVTAGDAVIQKAPVTITPVDQTKMAGDQDPALTATTSGVPLAGSALVYTTSRVAGETVGDYTISVTASDSANPNYLVTKKTGTLTITPKKTAVMIENVSKTYDGTTAFTTNPDVTVDGQTVSGLIHDDFNWSAVQADAGTYSLTLSSTGRDKVLATDPSIEIGSVTAGKAIINKAPVSLQAQDTTKVFGTSDPTQYDVVVTGQPTNGTNVVYTVSRVAGENVGHYDLTVVAGTNNNYEVTVQSGGQLTITPLATTAVTNTVHKTYDGTADVTTVPTLTLADGTVVDNLTTNDFDWTGVGANVQDYPVSLNAAGLADLATKAPNYTLTATDVMAGVVTVDPAKVTVTGNQQTKGYGDSDPILTATIDGKPINGASVNYTVTRDPGEDYGTYATHVTAGTNPNYTVTVRDGQLTIKKVNLTASLSNLTKIYDGTATFATVPQVTLDAGNKPVNGVSLTADDFDWSAVQADAGTYTVTLNDSGKTAITMANPNLQLANVIAGTVTINKARLTIAANAGTKVAGQVDPELTAKVTGVPTDGTAPVYTVTRSAGENVGDYDITVTAIQADNPNYQVTTRTNHFTITPLQLTAKINDITKTYDGDPIAQVPTVTLSDGTVPTLTTADFNWGGLTTNVGAKTVTLNAAGLQAINAANPNANLAASDVEAGTATIVPAKITITAVDTTKDASDTDPKLTATVTDQPTDGVTPIYTVTRKAGNLPGKYIVTVTADASLNPNYTIKTVPGTLTITATPVTATVGTVTKVYDGTATCSTQPKVTLAGVTGNVSGLTTDDFDWSAVKSDAGTYAVTLNDAGKAKLAENNPTIALTDVTAGTVTITPATATIALDPTYTKVAGQADPAFTPTVTGEAAQGDSLNYTVSREPGDGVGIYDVTVTLGDNPNYKVTKRDSSLTITPASVQAVVNSDLTKVYDGTASFTTLPTVTISGYSNVDTSMLTAADFDWGHVRANAGTYPITLSSTGIQTINAANPDVTLTPGQVAAGSVTITKCPVIVTVADQTMVYGDSEPTLTMTDDHPSTGVAVNATVVTPTDETVGTHALNVTLGANDNYDINVVAGKLTVTPALTAAVVGSITKTYDTKVAFKTIPEVTLTTTSGQAILTVPTLTAQDFDWHEVKNGVGTYTVTLNDAGIRVINQANPNTQLTSDAVTDGTAVVTPQPLTVPTTNTPAAPVNEAAPTKNQALPTSIVLQGATKVYDGTDSTDPTTVKVLGPTDYSNFTVPTMTADDFDMSGIDQQNVGRYELKLSAVGLAKLQAANPNYAFDLTDVQSGLLVITPAAITVTAPTVEKTYDGTTYSEPLQPTVTGVPDDGVQPVFSVTDVANVTHAGTTTLTTTAVSGTENYAVTPVAGKLTIHPAQLATGSIAVQGGTKVYDGTTTVPTTYEVKSSVSDFTVPTLTADDFDTSDVKADAGDYEVTLSASGLATLQTANPDYVFDESNVTAGSFTVTPAKVTITAPTLTKPYDGQPYTGDVTAAVTGQLASGDQLDYELSDVSGETAIGAYPIKVTLGDNPNYDVTVTNGELTITANDYALTTNYVTADGTKLAPSTTTKDHNYGDAYTTTELPLAGYYLTAVPENATGHFKGDTSVSYVYQKVGSYVTTTPSGQQTQLAYSVDEIDPTKVSVPADQVVPAIDGYTAVTGEAKTPLTAVDATDLSKGYQLPALPGDVSQDTQISYAANQPATSGEGSGNNSGTTGSGSTGSGSTSTTTSTATNSTTGTNTATTGSTTEPLTGVSANNDTNATKTPTDPETQSTKLNDGSASDHQNEPTGQSLANDQPVSVQVGATMVNYQRQTDTMTTEASDKTALQGQPTMKKTLPQTSEVPDSTTAGWLTLAVTGLLGLFGFKRKRDE